MRLFEGPGLLLLVFLAALASVPETDASKQPPGVKQRYIHFLKQHRDNSNSNTGGRYCNTMMARRGLTRPRCKEKNSFIHASDTAIKDVCGDKGEDYGNTRLSCEPFRVTTCESKDGERRPACEYTHDNRRRYISIACEQGYPVHFYEGRVILNRPQRCRR